MTDVLERPAVATPVAAPASAPASPRTAEVSMLGRSALAASMLGAALIHFVMVPAHLGEWTAEGVAFVVTGWVQLLLAGLVLRRASRVVLWTGIALNLAFAGAWAWTRVWGAPWGPHAGGAESAGFVDVICVALELAFVVGALALLVRPAIGASVPGRRSWAVAIIPVVLLGMTTAAIASPSARNHAHGGDGHDTAAGGTHSHDTGAAVGDHHGGDDKGLGMLHNGHHGAMKLVKVDALTQAKLDGQLAVTREVAATYPTLADAKRAGYTRQGPYSPGLGVHYGRYTPPAFNADGVMSREDLLNPMTIIYDGTEPTSKIAGFMYYSYAKNKPEGFIGPNDYWHYHTNTCIKPAADGVDAPLGADRDVTQADCAAVGGSMLDRTGWMVHVWTVRDYPVTDEHGGVFGEVNPALACPDGSYFIRPLAEWADHPLNICKSAT